MLPILDALPLYVAQEQGYFDEENLTVEFVPVSSAAERDQVIQAGQADAMINELLSTMFYNTEKKNVVVVRYARVPTPSEPQFRVLASGETGITDLADFLGQSIGISEGTIIEYSTDCLLEAEGYDPADFDSIAVPSIPDRLALLSSGELAGANLPDPLASLAMQGGAAVLVDDSSHEECGHSVISFRNEFLEDNSDAVKGFLSAIEKAVSDINEDKDQFSDLLTERQLVPQPLIGSYTIPSFPLASVPPPSQWEDMLDWAKAKGYLESVISYEESVDDSYLP